MNERLKELVDKTNDFMHTNYLNWLEAQSFYQSIWQEKFAELIIVECCVALHPTLRDMISRTQGVEMIVRHFRNEE